MCANAVSPLPTPEAHSQITKIDTARLVCGSFLKFDTRHGVFRCTATRSPLTLLTNLLLAGSSDMRGWGGREPHRKILTRKALVCGHRSSNLGPSDRRLRVCPAQ